MSNQNTPNIRYSCSGWSVFECEYKCHTQKFYEHKTWTMNLDLVYGLIKPGLWTYKTWFMDL